MNWKKKWYNIQIIDITSCGLRVANLNATLSLIYGLIFLCVFSIGCQKSTNENSRVATLPFYKEATFTPYWLDNNIDSLANFHQIAPFKLTNQNGRTITEKIFAGKIYIADFFFTACPGICPKMTKNMGVIQDAFIEDKDILLLSHSVTPEFDSVSVLKNYAINKDVVDDKWHLVTGDRDHIYDLGRNAYFVEEDLGLEKDPDDFLHTENFVLVDKKRHIRGIYNGLNKAAIRQLIADVKTLQQE